MRSCLLFLGVCFGYFTFGQKSQDTIPDLRKVPATQVISYQVMPDVEGGFDLNTGKVYETMVVSKNTVSKKSLRKLTNVLFKASTYTLTFSNSQPPSTEGTLSSAEQKETSNAPKHSETLTINPSTGIESGRETGTSSHNVNPEGSGSVSAQALDSLPLDSSTRVSGGISNRFTHIITFENDRYVHVALCVNHLEKSVQVYSFMQPKNLKQAFDPTKPYIFSGKLSEKARLKIRKFIP